MNKKHFRPAGPPGRGDKYLRDVARDVQRAIGQDWKTEHWDSR